MATKACDGLKCVTSVEETTFGYVPCEGTPTTVLLCHGRLRHLCAECRPRYAATVKAGPVEVEGVH